MEVARYLGRLKELMDGKRKNGYAYGRGEKYSLELGGDINRAIASEFAMLAAPETLPLFLRKLQRKALKQYQRREPICKGSGDIICMLDESSSAESQAPGVRRWPWPAGHCHAGPAPVCRDPFCRGWRCSD